MLGLETPPRQSCLLIDRPGRGPLPPTPTGPPYGGAMGRIAYTVVATLPSEALARAYVEWLQDGHIDAVVAGGAERGSIVVIEEPASPRRVEARYEFASREAFDRYVTEVAPPLRAEGLARFGPEHGVVFERRVGRVL